MREFEGTRARLRRWRDEDVDFVYDLYSRWDVQRYLGHSPSVMQTRDEAATLVSRLITRTDPVLGYWAVESVATGAVVGTVILQRIRSSGTTIPSDEIEIGWHFHPDAWGQGFATESAQFVLDHAFEAGLERVIAVVVPGNAASDRVCLRLGMKPEGTMTRFYDAEYEVFAIANPSITE